MENNKKTYGGIDNLALSIEEAKAKEEIDSNENDLRQRKSTLEEDSSPGKPVFEDLPYDPNQANILARLITGIRRSIYHLVTKTEHKQAVKWILLGGIFLLYNAYFVTAILYNRRNNIPWLWCDGHGMLIILTALTYFALVYYNVIKRYFGKAIYEGAIKPVTEKGDDLMKNGTVRVVTVLAVLAAVVAFVAVDARKDTQRLISAGGVVVMVLLGLLFSQHPGRVQWRQVLGGMGVQFVFGLLVLRWEGGRSFLDCVSTKVTTFLDFSNEGSNFIYGYLSSGEIMLNNRTGPGPKNETFVVNTLFAFQALSVIYFFSFFVGLLYHLGIMTWVVMKLGWLLQVLLGTTAAESMNASANIFLGQTEAPILIKPFLNDMTGSEVHAVMTGGFATIAGGVMAAYISFGVDASSLLTCSVMAAPAALAMSKLVYPETQISKTNASDIKKINTRTDGNALDAAAQGASQGFVLIGNIIANLIAVISFVAFLNSIISWLGVLVGQDQLSFEYILGKIFIPIAYCLGVDSADVEDISLLLGLKTVVNEFVAYQRLISIQDKISPRSRKIAEYALCSFANFSSVGIQLGGLGTLAPERRPDFSRIVWSALLAGTLTSLLNACVAGALISV